MSQKNHKSASKDEKAEDKKRQDKRTEKRKDKARFGETKMYGVGPYWPHMLRKKKREFGFQPGVSMLRCK
ncbi:hypothetical protein [Paraburkholderia tagetis]|uniref:Uncharacterized protein n=1 Tax=Paraburkholderia tagetis TaxID=2913261 RepID=A0A9X1RIS5_9BURK|nr:hypothetical protein [Paraburkholderia tagetis]MCG5071925.1 hypothetical protein [Paraburkholderia tagetis]